MAAGRTSWTELGGARAGKAARLLRAGLATALLALLLAGCDGNNGSAGTTGSTNGTGTGKPAHLEFRVGEEAAVGDVVVLVTMLTLTERPSLPQFPIDSGPGFEAAGREAFCQAFVKVRNGGDAAVRVDPSDFSLSVDGDAALLDRARSGPAARSLLHGASIDLILTYVVPADAAPSLVYRPPWLSGSLTFSGESRPQGAR